MAIRMKPGEPQIPVYGTLFGISSLDNVSIQILNAECETLHGYCIPPAPPFPVNKDHYLDVQGDASTEKCPNPPANERDERLYAKDAFYPGVLAELGHTGHLRGQPVAQAQWYPLQYNPVTGDVRFYHRIRARISWRSPLAQKTSPSRYRSPAFENLLKNTLVNYPELNRVSAGMNNDFGEHQGNNKSPECKGKGTELLQSPTSTGNDTLAPIIKGDGTNIPLDEEGQTVSSNNTPALKIGITEDGVYKITYRDIVKAGWNVSSIDPRNIIMQHREKEIPIIVSGEADGVFHPNDYILFYGVSNKDIYTNKNIYWLKAGNKKGVRMATKNGAISGNDVVPDNFPALFHAEEDSNYWQTIPYGWGEDHWFWGVPFGAPETRSYPIPLKNISITSGTATVRVRLKGRTNDGQLSPDHHTQIYLNDVMIDDQRWEGQTIYDHITSIPQTSLQEGTNTVQVASVGDTGAVVDQILVNWIEIGYLDTYVAENDALLFNAPTPGVFRFEVKNVTSNNAIAFDITDAENVIRIKNTSVFKEKGAYTLAFKDAAETSTRYLALTPSQCKKPETITPDLPTSWKSPLHGADYIIITHNDFYARSQKLARYQRRKGMRVVTIKTEDVYDEFNSGIFNPTAIRNLLSYAYNNWKPPAPTYVVLIGDGCQDYKDNYHTYSVNYVPSQIVETELLGETPSDNWYVCVDGDDVLPDMLIGRLSAQTPTEVTDIINKIILYDTDKQTDTWKERVLLVADDDDLIFEETSDVIASIVPQDYPVKKVYVRTYTSGNPKDDILQAMNEGTLFINYAGHGATDRWGIWKNLIIFGNTDLLSLTNEGKPSIVTVADCLNGFFPGFQTKFSLAEGFQRLRNKGAVAVWAPTGLSFPYGHQLLMGAFYKEIFEKGNHELGAATTAAKINTFNLNNLWSELVETYILFGDPAMQVPVAAKP